MTNWPGTRYKRHLAHGANSRAAGRSLGVESRRLASQFQPPCFDLPTDLQKRSTSEHPKLLPSSQERGTQWHGVILYPQIAFPRRKTSVTLGSWTWSLGTLQLGFWRFLFDVLLVSFEVGAFLQRCFNLSGELVECNCLAKKYSNKERTIKSWPDPWHEDESTFIQEKKTQEVEISTIVTIPQPQPNSSPNPPNPPKQ